MCLIILLLITARISSRFFPAAKQANHFNTYISKYSAACSHMALLHTFLTLCLTLLTHLNRIDYQFSSENELELPESESASVSPSKSQSALEPLSSSSSETKF